MILNYFSVHTSYKKIKSMIKQDKSGISAYEIIKIAKHYNLKGTGYKNYKISKTSYFPFIAHIVKNDVQHFVIIFKLKSKNILIYDPAYGKYWLSIDEFNKNYTGVAIVIKKENKLRNKKFFDKKFIIVITFIILFFSLLNIFYSFLFSYILENGKKLNNMTKILLLFLFTGFIKELIDFFKSKLLLRRQLLIDKSITIPTLKKIINLPQNFFKDKPVGEIITKFNDLSYFKEMIFSFDQVLYANLFILLISFLFLFFINTKILILTIFIVFLTSIYLKSFYKKNSYKNYDLQLKNELLNSKITSVIQMISSIKNLAIENFVFNKLKTIYIDVLFDYKILSSIYQEKKLIINLIIFISTFITIIFLINNNASISNMFFIINLELIIFNSLNSILSLLPLYINYKVSKERLSDLFNQKEINNQGTAFIVNSIVFKEFTYKVKNKVIFSNFSLNLVKGDFVLITGQTGSGKTTLFKLLTRQINGSFKDIYINNKELYKYNIDSIRKSITYTEQKFKLLNSSIIENIILDKSLNLRKKFKQIFDKELSKNKLSYDTLIDSNNTNLSEGQLSLIKVAQVLNNSGDVIIFDETTNNMDINLERKVLKAIKEEYNDKIIIFISHRLSNKSLFNKVITFS